MNEQRGAWWMRWFVALAAAIALMPVVDYKAPPTVARFLKSDAFVRTIVGPIGSGKSSGCIIELVRRAYQQKPDQHGVRRTRFAVIRNTRPQLEATTRKTFDEWIPETAGRWKEAKLEYLLRGELSDGTRVKSEILFLALDKPKDVRKVLSLDLTGCYVNELREIAKDVFDGLTGRVGRYPAQRDGGPSWRGVWADTNVWSTGSWGHQLFSVERPPQFELFEQPSGLSPKAENLAGLEAGYYQRLCFGKDQEWVDAYVKALYPRADKGSVYGELLEKLKADERVGQDFEHPSDGVFATFDLGVSDATSIWWWRLNQWGFPDLIDWYEATGKGMAHYFKVLDERPWKLHKIWLPHDARHREFQTGVTTYDQFAARFGAGMVAIGPELGKQEGISAARWLLEQKIRFHARVAKGVELLGKYRYVWDETRKVYSREPMHDYTSHTADGFRYVACVALVTEQLMRKPVEDKKPAARAPNTFTLNELWETAPRRS